MSKIHCQVYEVQYINIKISVNIKYVNFFKYYRKKLSHMESKEA